MRSFAISAVHHGCGHHTVLPPGEMDIGKMLQRLHGGEANPAPEEKGRDSHKDKVAKERTKEREKPKSIMELQALHHGNRLHQRCSLWV